MCVTAYPAKLSGTQIVLGQTANGERYIWYKNTVSQGTSGADFLRPHGALGLTAPRTPQRKINLPGALQKDRGEAFDNMMFWPVPGVHATIKPVEAETATQALKDIEELLTPRSRSISRGGSDMSFGLPVGKGAVNVFKTKFYTYVIAEYASDIPAALNAKKFRLVGPAGASYEDALKKFEQGYGNDMPIALMLFKKAQPTTAAVLLKYQPLPELEHLYFAPCLDGHGSLDLTADVDTDHVIAIGTPSGKGQKVHYSDLDEVDAAARKYLPEQVIGHKFSQSMPNGDFWFHVEDVEQGKLLGHRLLPFNCKAEQAQVEAVYLTQHGITSSPE